MFIFDKVKGIIMGKGKGNKNKAPASSEPEAGPSGTGNEGGGADAGSVSKEAGAPPVTGCSKRKRDIEEKNEIPDIENLVTQKKQKPSHVPNSPSKYNGTGYLREKNNNAAASGSASVTHCSFPVSTTLDSSIPQASLKAATLSIQGESIKSLHVDNQNRYNIERLVAKITTGAERSLQYSILSEATKQEKKLILKGPWFEIDWLTEGTLVNIVGVKEDEQGRFYLDRDQGFLVVEPDKLVSATSIVSQLWCERKTALTSKYFAGTGDNTNTFRGVLAHELICTAMEAKMDTMEQLTVALRSICERQDTLERAYGVGLTDESLSKMEEHVVLWVNRFLRNRFLPSSKLDPKYQDFAFTKLAGVEDNIWNPTFGLKGKIDATVQIQRGDKHLTVPLEFKTGSAKKRANVRAEHTGQVALYTLMMGIKFGDIEEALLYYISDDTLSVHPTRVFELQQLMILRNKFLRNTTLVDGQLKYLPTADVDYNFKCSRCEIYNLCAAHIWHKLHVDKFDPENLTNTEDELYATSNIDDKQFFFLMECWRCINLETEEIEKGFNDKSLWTKTPAEREKTGNCLTDLKIVGGCTPYKGNQGKWGYLISLTKRQKSTEEVEIPFHVDDYVVFSSNIEPCINHGVIVMISGREITLLLEQPLHQDYLSSDSGFIYCVDKLNTSSPISSMFAYVAKLMDESDESTRLRDYVASAKQPVMSKIQVPNQKVQDILDDLNVEQKRVITKSLATDSFLFVKGSPGSGKTTTIVGLVRALVESGKTVLVTSYTGTALENILVKYKRYSNKFIKISSSAKGDAKLLEFTTKELTKNTKRIAEMTEIFNAPVVGTTLLSMKHPLFRKRRFDYCIVDEASQALPMTVFGALTVSDKYIIFGDPNQLPPVFLSQKNKDLRTKDNFFSLMAEPLSTVKLNIQYRMNGTICNLANQFMYDNQMVCASTALQTSYIRLARADIEPFLVNKVPYIPARRVFSHTVSKKLCKAVVFLDTSEVAAFEMKDGETLANETEKNIVLACCRLFMNSKLDPSQLGVIAPYRGQVNLLRKSLQELKGTEYHSIEVNTVDQYQGREMEAIICSFTKSLTPGVFQQHLDRLNSSTNMEGILEDMRRVNVAITRARTKLVLIGNRKTLALYKPFRKLFQFITDEQMYKLTEEEIECLGKVVQDGITESL